MCVWAQACVSMGVPVSECMGTRPGSPLCTGECVGLCGPPVAAWPLTTPRKRCVCTCVSNGPSTASTFPGQSPGTALLGVMVPPWFALARAPQPQPSRMPTPKVSLLRCNCAGPQLTSCPQENRARLGLPTPSECPFCTTLRTPTSPTPALTKTPLQASGILGPCSHPTWSRWAPLQGSRLPAVLLQTGWLFLISHRPILLPPAPFPQHQGPSFQPWPSLSSAHTLLGCLCPAHPSRNPEVPVQTVGHARR